MEVNAGSYYIKKANNPVEGRVDNAKLPLFGDEIVLQPSQTIQLDLDQMKANAQDGISVGEIKCRSVGDIVINVNCRLDNSVNSPDIRINYEETFDLGMFNGRIRNISITNTNANYTTIVTILGM